MKYEEVYLHEYENPRAACRGLAAYFEFYKQERLCQTLNYRTPAEVYFDPTLQREKQETQKERRKRHTLKKADLLS